MAEAATMSASSGAVRWPRWLMLAARLLIGLVFVYAAYTKLRQPWMHFAFSIDSYHVLPTWAAMDVARVLPWFELGLGLLLLTGWKLRWVASAGTLLLGLFFAVMVHAYLDHQSIDCGCFGLGEKLGVRTLARDASLLAVSLALTIGAFFSARRRA